MSAPTGLEMNASDLDDLSIWRRFHVVVTALFGLPMLLVAGVAIALWYQRAVARETDSLQIRLRDGAIAMSYTLDPAGWVGAPSVERCAPYKQTFAGIASSQGDVASIYMVRHLAGADASTLEFMCDWTAADRGAAATPGDHYNANQADGLLDAFTRPQVTNRIYSDAWGPTISGYAPVRDASGQVVGVIGVDMAGSRVEAMQREIKLGAFGLFAFTAVLLAVVARLAGAALRDPMMRILQATTSITAGRLEARAGLDRRDEFGILARHLDDMAAGLEEREYFRDTFGRYLSDKLAKRLLGDKDATRLGGEEVVVTVLFCDLRGTAPVGGQVDAPVVLQLINAYIGATHEVVDKHRGMVVEFLGDAVLAVFGAPEEDPNHAEHAIRAAIELRQRIAALDEDWQQAGAGHVRARIGVHTGRVVAGNMGGHSRMKYAVIGDAVNVASRVENLNDLLGTDILATSATLDRVPSDLKILAESKGDQVVKGRAIAVAVSEIRWRPLTA